MTVGILGLGLIGGSLARAYALAGHRVLAAVAAGADGLMIEVHNDPAHALCDGAQSLTPDQFAALAKRVVTIREAIV